MVGLFELSARESSRSYRQPVMLQGFQSWPCPAIRPSGRTSAAINKDMVKPMSQTQLAAMICGQSTLAGSSANLTTLG
jgi:hypothetical protein